MKKYIFLYKSAIKERVGAQGEAGVSVVNLRAHRQDRSTTTWFKDCRLVLLFISLVVTSCVTDVMSLDMARSSRFSNDPFKEKLRVGYISMAEQAKNSGDQKNYTLYGRKAVDLVRGIHIEPDSLLDRQLEEAQRSELLAARTFIMMSYTKGSKKLVPEVTADLQLAFDCWAGMEERNEATNNPVCMERFDQNRDQILIALKEDEQRRESAMMQRRQSSAPVTPPPAQAQVQPPVIEQHVSREINNIQVPPLPREMPDPYLVFFEINRSNLDHNTIKTLHEVASVIPTYKPRKIILSGHADRSGSAKQNVIISQQRAENVAEYLINLGVNPDILDIRIYGEKSQRAIDIDKEADQRNRFVRITFLRDNAVYY